ncbi:MAG: lipo-like protein [Myxococcota bacterium]
MGLRRWLTQRLIDFLTQPLPYYERHSWNDLDRLKKHIRKGDVLLVDGDSRVATVIKYLSQSSWSHTALYIGDELVRREGPAGEAAVAQFGDQASFLLLEALPQGVVASPLSKYTDYNIRLVRPHRLRPDHLKRILDEAIASLGWKYDLQNILDLCRYLLPVSLVPERFRRTALHFGSGTPTEVICSSLLGRLFHRVGFPILPTVDFPDGFDAPSPRRGVLRLVLGHESPKYTGLFRMRHPTLLTPRDFDLSPYFEVIKFNVIATGGFDYQRIQWVAGDSAGEEPETREPETG